MRLLLDTEVWLWLQVTPERLGAALPLAENPSHVLLFSAASSWEIAIKWRLGKLPLPEAPEAYVPDRVVTSGVVPLPVAHSHALAVASLPTHHSDPFDRLLIAQATAEKASLLTADRSLAPYDLDIVWAG
jgi:PIN domain nuclease of toxin-antitoxin system